MSLAARRNVKLEAAEPPEASELRREIQVWRRTRTRMAATNSMERAVQALLDKKIIEVEAKLARVLLDGTVSAACAVRRWRGLRGPPSASAGPTCPLACRPHGRCP